MTETGKMMAEDFDITVLMQIRDEMAKRREWLSAMGDEEAIDAQHFREVEDALSIFIDAA